MKITLLSHNQFLNKALKDNIFGVSIEAVPDIKSVDLETDILIIDGAVIALQDISNEITASKMKILYLDASNKPVKDQQARIMVIQYDSRTITAIDAVKRTITGLKINKNVFTFWSPISGTGTTTIALSVFNLIPKNYRTLFLSLTDVVGTEYAGVELDGSLSDILPRLITGVLDSQEIMNACTQKENQFYLGGLNSFVDVPPYSPENIKTLISMVSAWADYVIVDAGYGPSVMAIAALSASAMSYVVTTPSFKAAKQQDQLQRQIYSSVPEISSDRMRLIFNFEDKEAFISGRTSKSYGLHQIASVRRADSVIGLRAEYEGELIYEIDTSSSYRKDIEILAGAVFSDMGISTEQEHKAGRGGILAGLFRRAK